MDQIWDCVVVGGGASGLSAALVLGRARRRTLVVDAGEPSNRASHGIGGLLGHDGRPPDDFYAHGRAELERYPSVELRSGRVVRGRRAGDEFELELAAGDSERARRVLLATGMDYRPPELPGLAPLWGDTVFHCPFCHGWEVRDQPLAVLAEGEHGVHAAQLLRAWSDDVVLLDAPVSHLVAEDGKLAAIAFADGTELPRRGLMVVPALHQRSDLAHQLGAASAEPGPLAADALAVDAMQATTAAGVYAAGDLTGQPPSVASAVASGAFAAAMLVRELVTDLVGGKPDGHVRAPAVASNE